MNTKQPKFVQQELGERKISKMNFSYIVTLPKKFVQNQKTGQVTTMVKLSMLDDGSLKIIPVRMKDDPSDLSVM
ncbi:MAG: hypothetical protein KGI28_09970 [Thaumarchaeota archaeon]|nr:hypothetical protein [Nitrososphaerota archaeon]